MASRKDRPTSDSPWPIAAGLGLGLLLGAMMLLVSCQGPANRLTLPDGELFEIEPLPFDRPVTRQAAGLEKQWQEAGAAYQSGDYARSASLFAEIGRTEKRDPERHDAALYQGISLLMDGRAEQAEKALRQSRALAEEIDLAGTTDNYYLGLAALAQQELELATETLEQAMGGPFDEDARDLLRALTGD